MTRPSDAAGMRNATPPATLGGADGDGYLRPGAVEPLGCRATAWVHWYLHE
ncbi:MAG: hypothetical protein R2851_02880 [Caldilineaceae bacterium]